jgi:hypothetical protein
MKGAVAGLIHRDNPRPGGETSDFRSATVA